MVCIAVAGKGECLSIKQVSKSEDISEKYLEQIISYLLKGNLLISVRGAHGGYKPARADDEYTVGEILRAVEGELVPVSCLEKGAKAL